ncbi:MAG TPA: AAA family ATPase [Bacillota bacterium]|nr:AAA family ATPase [Bacillota bacterium]
MTSAQENGLRNWVQDKRVQAPTGPRMLAVTGGKGGVGKSNFSLNFAIALGQLGQRTLLIDCDSGLGNIDVLLGLYAPHHLGQVMTGEATIDQAIMAGPGDLEILPAASGVQALGKATAAEAGRLLKALAGVSQRYQVVIFDTSAGLGPQVRSLLKAAPEAIVITTPEPTALADAYATIKVLAAFKHPPAIQVVVNSADNAREAQAVIDSIAAVSARFLGQSPSYLGFIPKDPSVPLAVKSQSPFLVASPNCPASRAVKGLAAAWTGAEPVAEERPDLWSMFRSMWGNAGAVLRPSREKVSG